MQEGVAESKDMKPKASRAKKVRLAPGREIRTGHGAPPVLVHPTGTVQLNESAAAILTLCDGTLTRQEVVARVVRGGTGEESLAMDVREFLEAALRRGWVEES
jgi:hypothetical protein